MILSTPEVGLGSARAEDLYIPGIYTYYIVVCPVTGLSGRECQCFPVEREVEQREEGQCRSMDGLIHYPIDKTKFGFKQVGA